MPLLARPHYNILSVTSTSDFDCMGSFLTVLPLYCLLLFTKSLKNYIVLQDTSIKYVYLEWQELINLQSILWVVLRLGIAMCITKQL